MALSAKPGKSNDGQTDKGRGSVGSMPRAKPRGRVEARGGSGGTKSNDASPSGLARRAPGGGATNGSA